MAKCFNEKQYVNNIFFKYLVHSCWTPLFKSFESFLNFTRIIQTLNKKHLLAKMEKSHTIDAVNTGESVTF